MSSAIFIVCSYHFSEVEMSLTDVYNEKHKHLTYCSSENRRCPTFIFYFDYLFQYDGHTALHISAWEGDEMLVKYLYQMKANPNLCDKVHKYNLYTNV